MTQQQIIFLIKEIARENNHANTLAVIENSSVEFKVHPQHAYSEIYYDIIFKINPQTFIKINSALRPIKETLKTLLIKVSKIRINEISLIPDYDKLSIVNSEVSIVETEWEEINSLQSKLIDLSKQSLDSIDYQNIGNSARTLMDKLARIVYVENLHKPDDSTIDVRNGKFKNQLHSYIVATLKGSQNEDIRKLGKAAVELMEKAIDLMNVTTHKLDVQKQFAELCVISSISVISVIKSIHEIK